MLLALNLGISFITSQWQNAGTFAVIDSIATSTTYVKHSPDHISETIETILALRRGKPYLVQYKFG
jgi:hypothetical protein